MYPSFLNEVSSLFNVASEIPSLFAKSSLIIDGFCFMIDSIVLLPFIYRLIYRFIYRLIYWLVYWLVLNMQSQFNLHKFWLFL